MPDKDDEITLDSCYHAEPGISSRHTGPCAPDNCWPAHVPTCPACRQGDHCAVGRQWLCDDDPAMTYLLDVKNRLTHA